MKEKTIQYEKNDLCDKLIKRTFHVIAKTIGNCVFPDAKPDKGKNALQITTEMYNKLSEESKMLLVVCITIHVRVLMPVRGYMAQHHPQLERAVESLVYFIDLIHDRLDQ